MLRFQGKTKVTPSPLMGEGRVRVIQFPIPELLRLDLKQPSC